jgi:hypothetical protein
VALLDMDGPTAPDGVTLLETGCMWRTLAEGGDGRRRVTAAVATWRSQPQGLLLGHEDGGISVCAPWQGFG